jgi:hypothetical protein
VDQMGRTLHVRLSRERFVVVELVEPPGEWFTDGHLQEILVAFADSFAENYSSAVPRIFRTPRCTFSLSVFPKSFRSFIFRPTDSDSLETLASVPKTFYIRVLGRSDVGECLGQNGHPLVDSALRLARPAGTGA